MKSEGRAEKIRLLVLDVDGVLTDGSILINDRGQEVKAFHVKDGHGLRLLMDEGIHVALISGRHSGAVRHRAEDLGIQGIHLGIKDKERLLQGILKEKGLQAEQVCCVGDDLPDLVMFQHAGLRIAVADAAPEVKEAAHWVTLKKGGQGAVREVCELILKAQGRWPQQETPERQKIGFAE